MAVSADFPASVAERPEVFRVVVCPARTQRQFRIIHLCNWHMIPRESFDAVLKTDGLDDVEICRRFEEHAARVESVQREQHSLMMFLVKELQLTAVHLEGLCAEDAERFAKRLRQLQSAVIPDRNSPSRRELAETIRQDRLFAGTAGRLSMEGVLNVLPVEDRSVFDAANPMTSDYALVEKPAINEVRESEIVRHLIHDGKVTFVILGGLHDLSDNVPEDCEYIRIETRRYAELMKQLKSRLL